MWYGRGIERATAERSGWGEGWMRKSRRGRSGRRRFWARSNGAGPYLNACGMHGCAGGATAKVDCINCARGGAQLGVAGQKAVPTLFGKRKKQSPETPSKNKMFDPPSLPVPAGESWRNASGALGPMLGPWAALRIPPLRACAPPSHAYCSPYIGMLSLVSQLPLLDMPC